MARISFVELPVVEADRARRFYAEAFGWDTVSFGPTYHFTTTGDVDLGLQADAEEAPGAPLAVIAVDDLDAAYGKVQAAGGIISKEIFSFPGGRRFHFIDPSGNELAAWVTEPAGGSK